jgi:hypothetical protein
MILKNYNREENFTKVDSEAIRNQLYPIIHPICYWLRDIDVQDGMEGVFVKVDFNEGQDGEFPVVFEVEFQLHNYPVEKGTIEFEAINMNVIGLFPNANNRNWIDGSISALDNRMTYDIPYLDVFPGGKTGKLPGI